MIVEVQVYGMFETDSRICVALPGAAILTLAYLRYKKSPLVTLHLLDQPRHP